MSKLSAVVVVYNEESHIVDCLSNLHDIVDDIILIHDGPCKDNTLTIARQFSKVRIFQSKVNVGEAEPHRVFGIESCKYDIIVTLDSDERFSDELKKFILKHKTADMIKANWRRMSSDTLLASQSYKIVQFNRTKISYVGIPHKSYTSQGKVLVTEDPLIHLELQLPLHKYFKQKYLRWSKLQAKYYVSGYREPKSIPMFNTTTPLTKNECLRVQFPILTILPICIFIKFSKKTFRLFVLCIL